MKTEFGQLTLTSVYDRLREFDEVGKDAFLARYANGRGARSTWIAWKGQLYPAKAVFAAALKPRRSPPEFNTSDTYVFARLLGFADENDLELIRIEAGTIQSGRSALNDLDDLNGPEIPIQVPYSGTRYMRDGKIRAAVLKRARGKCEHCGWVGFETSSGRNFLETHHIISLADQGPDTLQNVIALCPNDHRRAHFGADWKELEMAFLKKIGGGPR